MYQVGDIVLYGKTGVCSVEEIKVDSEGAAASYVLKPLYQTCSITIPAGNPKIFIRPVISKKSALDLIHKLPSMETEQFQCRNLNQLRAYYMEKLDCRSCEELARLAKSLREKQRQAAEQKKKFGTVNERFLREAENLLFGELAVALDIPRDEVPQYIENCLA